MKLLAIDFETTGLMLHPDAKLPLQPRAIEWGAVLVDEDGTVLEEQSFLINPGQEIEAVITSITGITNEMLADKPRFAEVLPAIRAIMEKADVLAAHNLPFDRSILEVELRHEKCEAFPWPQRELCTVQAYQQKWGRRPKLLELYEFVIGVPLAQTHRALDDVKALAEIIIKDRLLDLFEGIHS
jgi:DNA polymerase III epsilon subunit-like protein